MANNYAMEIGEARTLDELDAIIERAANDESLTSAEYTALYNRALTVAQSWDARNN